MKKRLATLRDKIIGIESPQDYYQFERGLTPDIQVIDWVGVYWKKS